MLFIYLLKKIICTLYDEHMFLYMCTYKYDSYVILIIYHIELSIKILRRNLD